VKGIIVVNMPERCWDCNFFTDDCSCLARGVLTIDVDEMETRPEWCPIRPIRSIRCHRGFHEASSRGRAINENKRDELG